MAGWHWPAALRAQPALQAQQAQQAGSEPAEARGVLSLLIGTQHIESCDCIPMTAQKALLVASGRLPPPLLLLFLTFTLTARHMNRHLMSQTLIPCHCQSI